MENSRPCSYCYCKSSEELMLMCIDCKKRYYCSPKCRASDKEQHEIWCGCDAELNVDFEVRPAGEGRGMGMFSLRRFKAGDVILAERCVIRISEEASSVRGPSFTSSITDQFSCCDPFVQAAILELHAADLNDAPGCNNANINAVDEEVLKRWKGNFFRLKGNGCGLFITTARINHSCLSNCQRFFVNDHGLLVVTASRDIAEGEEFTISYTTKGHDKGIDMFQRYATSAWGFVCDCPACLDSTIFNKLTQYKQLEIRSKEICNTAGGVTISLDVGMKMLELCDDLGFGAARRRRIYKNMFRAAVMQRCNLEKAKEYAQKALESWELCFGGKKCKKTPTEVTKARLDLERPELHKSYLLLES